jgi:aminopeptidase-like protein
MKVGEVVIQGHSDDNLLLFAHLDHPAQANDGLSGVAVGIEAMRRLMAGPRPRYTVRFLIVSEGIGLSAWLTDNSNILKKTQTALALDMLGLDYPHVLEHSQKKNTLWGELAFNAVKSVDAKAVNVGPSQKDYEQHEFPEIPVHFPIHSLIRHVAPDGQVKGVPFPQHHSSDDNASLISEKSLATSALIVQKILNMWNNKKQGKAKHPSSRKSS